MSCRVVIVLHLGKIRVVLSDERADVLIFAFLDFMQITVESELKISAHILDFLPIISSRVC